MKLDVQLVLSHQTYIRLDSATVPKHKKVLSLFLQWFITDDTDLQDLCKNFPSKGLWLHSLETNAQCIHWLYISYTLLISLIKWLHRRWDLSNVICAVYKSQHISIVAHKTISHHSVQTTQNSQMRLSYYKIHQECKWTHLPQWPGLKIASVILPKAHTHST